MAACQLGGGDRVAPARSCLAHRPHSARPIFPSFLPPLQQRGPVLRDEAAGGGRHRAGHGEHQLFTESVAPVSHMVGPHWAASKLKGLVPSQQALRFVLPQSVLPLRLTVALKATAGLRVQARGHFDYLHLQLLLLTPTDSLLTRRATRWVTCLAMQCCNLPSNLSCVPRMFVTCRATRWATCTSRTASPWPTWSR